MNRYLGRVILADPTGIVPCPFAGHPLNFFSCYGHSIFKRRDTSDTYTNELDADSQFSLRSEGRSFYSRARRKDE